MSQSGNFLRTSGPGSVVQTLTGNTGGPVGPTGGNIDVVGAGNILVEGDPGLSTLTIREDLPSALAFDTDSGLASPDVDGLMNVIGAGGITTSGAGNTITIDGSGMSAGIEILDGDTGSATGSTVTIAGGNNITTAASAATVTIDVSGTTNNALQVGNATGSLTSLSVATNGQIPIGSTGVAPVIATITAGTNVTVTNGAGSITISANSGAVVYNYVSIDSGDSPYAALSSDYYISADSTGGAITVQLPNAPTTGRTFVVKDKNGTAATFNITITTVGGSVNIDGATTFVMNTAYESVSLIFGGSSYEIF